MEKYIILSLPYSSRLRTSSKFNIICIGDSLTYGSLENGHTDSEPYGKTIQERLGEMGRVDWLGYSGYSSNEILDAAEKTVKFAKRIDVDGMDKHLAKRRYKVAVVMAGTASGTTTSPRT